MKEKLIIIGTGLFAQMAKDYFMKLSSYDVVAFACHKRFKQTDTIAGLPLHPIEIIHQIFPPDEVVVFVAIGYNKMNKIRQTVYDEVKQMGYKCATFVYPNVKMWDSVELGDNVFIFEDNTIQPNTIIGNNSILWSGNHIGHHTIMGEHCFISSHTVISGNCKIGNNVFIGVNSTLYDGIIIGDKSLIGAGAIISKNTKPKSVYIESPTKLFSKDSEKIGF